MEPEQSLNERESLLAAAKKSVELSREHGNQFRLGAERWRNFSLVVAVLGLSALVGEHFLLLNYTDEVNSDSVLYAGAAVRVVSSFIVFWLLGFCFRNYRVQRHNEVLYRHREVCAEAFLGAIAHFSRANRDSATDPEARSVRDLLLPIVVKNIFEPSGSGFLTRGDKDYAPLEMMAETVRGLTAIKKST